MRKPLIDRRSLACALIAIALPATNAVAADPAKNGRWMTGDFHQHTLFTDGAHDMLAAMSGGFNYGLTFQANSEHGGIRTTDGYGRFWDDKSVYPVNPIIGDVKVSQDANGVNHQMMWRWQSIRDYAYPMIQKIRSYYPDDYVITGMEWNMPGHEHCSTAIVAKDASAISEFEYRFDASDADVSGGQVQGWTGKNTTNNHAKAVEGAAWMYKNYPNSSWMIPAHPERAASYKISDFRDLNNAGPTVAFGFEGLPGHQKESSRGSYSKSADGGGTYGGAGVYIAKVGGLWDSLLGEGRHWWTFVNSDFHSEDADFWPGEYAKTYTYVTDDNGDGKYSMEEIVSGLRSGNSFSVHGDLINALQFTAQANQKTATMGEDFQVSKGDKLLLTIRFKSPDVNNHGDKVQLDHIDLISGDVTGKVEPFLSDAKTQNPAYSKADNPSTKVLATFYSSEWKKDADGWVTVEYIVNSVNRSMYFRLRGTNLAPDTPYETDADGNPLLDFAAFENLKITPAAEAWSDLWFYSNPIFVNAK